MKSIPVLVTSALLALLAGCGGGGGGDSTPPPVTADAVAITPGNQTEVARAAVSGGFAVTLAQPLGTSGRETAQSAGPARRQGTGALQTAVRRVALAALAQRSRTAAERARPLAASAETEACVVSGKATSTFDDRDNNSVVSAGDVLTVVFARCKDTASDQIDGTLVFGIGSVVSSTATRSEFSGSLAFQQVAVVFGKTSASIGGSVDLAVVGLQNSLEMTLSVGSRGLSVSARSPGYNDDIDYEAGMRIKVTENLTTGDSLATLDGSFTATSIGGRVTASTPQALSRRADDDYPGAGQIRLSGGGGSQLRITVLDDTQLRLELDASGDGTFENSAVVPWAALTPG